MWERSALLAALGRERRRLARRLRDLRLQKGWSQETAAERLGIHPVHVSRIEAATANVSLAVLVAASLAYDVTLAELFAEPGRNRIAKRRRRTEAPARRRRSAGR